MSSGKNRLFSMAFGKCPLTLSPCPFPSFSVSCFAADARPPRCLEKNATDPWSKNCDILVNPQGKPRKGPCLLPTTPGTGDRGGGLIIEGGRKGETGNRDRKGDAEAVVTWGRRWICGVFLHLRQ